MILSVLYHRASLITIRMAICVMLSLIFSGQVKVVSCSYISGMPLVFCAEWYCQFILCVL